MAGKLNPLDLHKNTVLQFSIPTCLLVDKRTTSQENCDLYQFYVVETNFLGVMIESVRK